jgi:SAM-dependent methyltransferase
MKASFLRSFAIFLALVNTAFAGQQAQPENFRPVTASTLKPVYGPLAQQIVSEFGLANKAGIGIDLGSGPGDLIIELCKRTENLHWINADINPRFFPGFMQRASEAGFELRVSALYADAVDLPFRDNYADVLVSRGSFQFWGDLPAAIAEIVRVLKPGGVAFIGRGFSDNLPVETARQIRAGQKERDFDLSYDVEAVARQMENIVNALGIDNYKIRIPHPAGADDVKYGIWLEFHKPAL